MSQSRRGTQDGGTLNGVRYSAVFTTVSVGWTSFVLAGTSSITFLGRCNRPGSPDAVAGPRKGRTMPSIFSSTQPMGAVPQANSAGVLDFTIATSCQDGFCITRSATACGISKVVAAGSATCNSLRNLEGRCSRVTVPEKSCCAAVQQPVGVQPSAECRRLLQQREQLLRSGCSGATVCGMPKAVAAAPQATDAAVTLCAAVCGMPNVVAERTVDRVLAGTRCSRLRDADAEGCCSALTGITHSRVWGCRWWLQPDGRSRSRRGNVQQPVEY